MIGLMDRSHFDRVHEGMMDTIADASKGGPARRKRWPDDLKRRIVAETLEPGASVSVVARRHDVNANQVFTWRRRYRDGLPVSDGEATVMVPVRIAPARTVSRPIRPEPPPVAAAPPVPAPARPGVVEIELRGGVRVRIKGAVDGVALREVLSLLSRR
jgi:transposase